MNGIKKYSIYFAFLANLLIIVSFWWPGASELFIAGVPNILLALGRLAGYLAVYFVLLQFVFMGRAVWIEKTFGLDKLAGIHRLNGYFSILLIIIHPILITISYAMSGRVGIVSQFVDFIVNYEDLLQAAIAVLLFISIVFLSIYIVRKHLKYETWYFIHLLTYLAVLLAFSHQLKLGGDFFTNQWFVYYWYLLYLFVFGNLLVFRFIRPIYNFYKYRFSVSKIVQETSDTTSVYITGKNLQLLKIEPGQFIILRFLCKKFWWQAHPFSLSFLPKDNQIRVTIKNCGDFTSKISHLKIGTAVFVDGPYGIFVSHAKPDIKYLFIAGGVGITPIRALIEKVAPTNDLILLYSSKISKDIIFKNELDELSGKYHFPLHYIISDEKEYSGEQGRIDKEKLERLVKDIQQREVYMCGPISMTKSLNSLLQDLGLKRKHIHYEKFSL